jgi:hypothetical protein
MSNPPSHISKALHLNLNLSKIAKAKQGLYEFLSKHYNILFTNGYRYPFFSMVFQLSKIFRKYVFFKFRPYFESPRLNKTIDGLNLTIY